MRLHRDFHPQRFLESGRVNYSSVRQSSTQNASFQVQWDMKIQKKLGLFLVPGYFRGACFCMTHRFKMFKKILLLKKLRTKDSIS